MSKGHKTSSVVDIRGFRYALDPLRQKHEWKLESLQGQLRAHQQACVQAQQALSHLQQTKQSQLTHAQTLLGNSLDPQAHQRALAALVRLNVDIHHAQQKLHARRQAKSACEQACTEQRLKIEALDEHRGLQLTAYIEESSRIQLAQLDRDWMAHMSSKSAGAVPALSSDPLPREDAA